MRSPSIHLISKQTTPSREHFGFEVLVDNEEVEEYREYDECLANWNLARTFLTMRLG